MLLACGLALLAGASCGESKRATGMLPSDVYVWQRAWTPQVREALGRARGAMQSFVVLVAEISVGGEEPVVVKPNVDFAALAALKTPVGLAIRIGPFPGPFSSGGAKIQAIAELVKERIAEARQHGIEPSEIQIDFDCADSKLTGYRTWLGVIRRAAAPLPVRPTVLPSWLAQGAFAPLAHDCGGYVLQVHSVAPPRRPEDSGRLTDPKRAQQWVEQAGRIGVPFRVALPTYSYLVAFDDSGQVLGLSAEGVRSAWPPEARVVRWESEPVSLANLVAGWKKDRPQSMTGLIWYRLPVEGDTLNWRWTTLAMVMEGRSPRADVQVEGSEAQPNDIVIINRGEMDSEFPPRIVARANAAITAADALAGYALAQPPDGKSREVVFLRERAIEVSRLPPGARRNIGWIRCETPSHIDLRIESSPSDTRQGHGL